MFVLLAVAGTGYVIYRLRTETIGNHLRIAQMHVRTFEDHLTQNILVVDQMMTNLVETESLGQSPSVLGPVLTRSIRHMPQLRSLQVLDAAGRIVASSSAGNLGLAPRIADVMPAWSTEAAVDLPRIGLPWQGRDFHDGQEMVSGRPMSEDALGFIPMLRHVRSQGRDYTILAALNPDYFVQYYRQKLMDDPGSLHVLRYDGRLLLGNGDNHAIGEVPREEWQRLGLPDRELGAFDNPEANALTAFRASRLYPLVVVLNLDRADALTAWQEEARRFGGMAGLIILTISVSATLFFLRDRRLARERAASALAEKQRLGAVLDALPAMVFMVGADSQYRFINREGRAFFAEEELNLNDEGHYGTDAVSAGLMECNPEYFSRHVEDIRKLLNGEVDLLDSEHAMHLRSGQRWHHAVARRIEADGVNGAVIMVTDITARKEAEAQLHLAASVFKASAEGILVTDDQIRVLSVNAAFTQITGYSADEMLGKNPKVLASGIHDKHFYATMWQSLKDTGLWQGEIVNRRKNGMVYPEWLTISAVPDSEGQVHNYVGVFSDITDRKASEERIRHLSEHDFLTGLPNRILFQDRVTQAIAHAQRNEGRFALLFIDLDRFKVVNDTLGHHVGDLLLKEVARRVRSCVRAADTVSRQGGDEFLVLLENLEQPEDAGRVAEKLLAALSEACHLEGHELHVTPSIGISLYPEDGQDMATLIKSADMAMYHSKEHGRNTFHYFTLAMNASANERLMLEHGLRRALEQGELQMHYQPLVALDGNRIVGAEALMRWRHPEFGPIAPLKFIPVAEECGLIIPMGEWALRTVCTQGAAWLAAGLPAVTLAVNVSAPQFVQPAFLATVRNILEETGYPAEKLELEVTESLLVVQSEVLTANIEGLRQMGIRLSIDDFGTGYSSLSYLRKLPIDKLKIDRSFVRDVTLDADDAAITVSIIQMAHNIGLQVLAEGVETPDQLAFLRTHGCNQVQGYYFSPPLAAEDFTHFVRRKSAGVFRVA